VGTYYKVSNYDKHEVISLSSIANIKSCSFDPQHSLQTAILNTFLGWSWPYHGLKSLTDEWVGRWAKCRVVIESDADDNDSDEWDNTFDAGMAFLIYLDKIGALEEFLSVAGFPEFGMGWPLETLREYAERGERT
jgi:hypothetical protein